MSAAAGQRRGPPVKPFRYHVWRWVRLRGVVLVVVFACGLAGFSLGAMPSERPGLPGEPLLSRIYYALSLFVLGGTDIGVPVAGPEPALILTWFAYFAAPAVTASALVEAIVRTLRPELWRMRRMRGHVVIGGAGRLSMLFLRRLRETQPTRPVFVVEVSPAHPNLAVMRDSYGAHVLVGDIRSESLLSSLRLHRAHRVVLLTGDDLANLDAAAFIVEHYPGLFGRIIAHVSDLRLMHVLGRTRVGKECEIFNTHEIAARHLVSTEIKKHFAETKPLDCVVLAGFGRFGQTVLRELQIQAKGRFDTVLIIDLNAEERALEFDEHVRFDDAYRRELIRGDMSDPRIWRDVAKHFETRHPLLVLGSGSDEENLRSALWLSRKHTQATIVVRSFQLSAFAEEVADDHRIVGFGVAELVSQCMPPHWLE